MEVEEFLEVTKKLVEAGFEANGEFPPVGVVKVETGVFLIPFTDLEDPSLVLPVASQAIRETAKKVGANAAVLVCEAVRAPDLDGIERPSEHKDKQDIVIMIFQQLGCSVKGFISTVEGGSMSPWEETYDIRLVSGVTFFDPLN